MEEIIKDMKENLMILLQFILVYASVTGIIVGLAVLPMVVYLIFG